MHIPSKRRASPLLSLQILPYLFVLIIATDASSQTLPGSGDILSVMKLVNDYWVDDHDKPGGNGWERSVYFAGNMAMYEVCTASKYLEYAIGWAEQNNWAPGSRPRNADDQCCGQTYIDLFKLDPDPARIALIKQHVDEMVNSEKKDDWRWIDALFMAMPVFAGLGDLFDEPSYFAKLYDLYEDCKVRRALYDTDHGLWYRDSRYMSPDSLTPNGERVFWSRGNGWVFGAHVRTLQLLPKDDPHRDEYIETFRAMASALKDAQRSDGFWGVSLADMDHFPGPETSGTSLFTYGLAWGINNGILDSKTYYPVVARAWNGLVETAVHPDGFLGYVQGVGSNPAASQPVTYDNTTDYGIGVFLLAGSEVYKLADGKPVPVELALFEGFVDGKNAVHLSWTTFSESDNYGFEVETQVGTDWRTVGFVAGQGTTSAAHRYTFVDNTVDATSVSWSGRYRLKQIDNDGMFHHSTEIVVSLPVPETTVLAQNYPNPFNPVTAFEYHLANPESVTLKIFSLSGQEIETLVNEIQPAGRYRVRWQPDGLASGVYLYRLKAGAFFELRRLVYVR